MCREPLGNQKTVHMRTMRMALNGLFCEVDYYFDLIGG